MVDPKNVKNTLRTFRSIPSHDNGNDTILSLRRLYFNIPSPWDDSNGIYLKVSFGFLRKHILLADYKHNYEQ